MKYLLQVQQGVDYIEARLGTDIELADVAAAACISQWHFQRIFKALTNESLKSYIRSRRLAVAFERLVSSNDRIIDIAIESGFGSQQSFSRAFKKVYGMTPDRCRKLDARNVFPKKVQFDEEYLRHINTNLSLEPVVTDWPEMTIVGLPTTFYGSASEKNTIAEKLLPLWAAFVPRMDDVPQRVDDRAFGIIVPDPQGERLNYLAGVETAEPEQRPSDMTSMTIPASRYAVFRHRGHPSLLDQTVNYVYATWLLQSGQTHSYGPDLEIYGPDYQPDDEASAIYYAIPLAV